MSPMKLRFFRNLSATMAMGLTLATGAAAGLSGCGGPNEYMTQGTGSASGSDAELVVDRMEGSTTKLVKLNMKFLPPPDRAFPEKGKTTYVVWHSADGGSSNKAGRLNYDAETREGKLQFTSPDEKFTVFVTAEENDAVSSPSSDLVLKQEVE